jgi:hypothetical protein
MANSVPVLNEQHILRDTLYFVRDWLEDQTGYSVYTDRLNANIEDTKYAIIYFNDENTWRGTAKEPEFRFVLQFIFLLDQLDSSYNEIDAQDEVYNIWNILENMPVRGKKIEHENIRFAGNDTGKYIAELQFRLF